MDLKIVNLHQGFFILTRKQLKDWIKRSDITKVRNFKVNDIKYAILESAATQPYIENNFDLFIDILNIENHLVFHMGNNYPNRNITVQDLFSKVNYKNELKMKIHNV